MLMDYSKFHSGYVAILGLPNVGKSTMLNSFLGQKMAITCDKPQTTRHKILGIKNTPEAQILFLDTPGVHQSHKSLNDWMMDRTWEALSDADLTVLVLTVPHSGAEREAQEKLWEKLRDSGKPYCLAFNKIDFFEMEKLALEQKKWADRDPEHPVIAVSALNKFGFDLLENEIVKRLPLGPPFYPLDQTTDHSQRFAAAEMVREKILQLTHQEIPYSVAVVIEDFKEPKPEDKKKVVRIRAAIIVERDSQKIIVIGKGGEMIKKIGMLARLDLEKELEEKVFLELFVRVEKDWTKDKQKVQEFCSM